MTQSRRALPFTPSACSQDLPHLGPRRPDQLPAPPWVQLHVVHKGADRDAGERQRAPRLHGGVRPRRHLDPRSHVLGSDDVPATQERGLRDLRSARQTQALRRITAPQPAAHLNPSAKSRWPVCSPCSARESYLTRAMRAVRLGSYSIRCTVPCVPRTALPMSMTRYLRLWPPPRCRRVLCARMIDDRSQPMNDLILTIISVLREQRVAQWLLAAAKRLRRCRCASLSKRCSPCRGCSSRRCASWPP